MTTPPASTIADTVLSQLQAIQAHNARLRALILEPRAADVQARVAALSRTGPGGPLHGMTLSLKDNIDTAGLPTTAGAAFWRDRVPDTDALVVQRLHAAGAILFGKANMTELAWGVRSRSAVGGQCLNPLDETRIAGGSSGGSAAAVAARFCTASLGTDTGGSIRIPAAFCGLVGLRPTYGTVSNDGVLPLSASHDTVGPIARTVADAAHVFAAIAGNPRPDPTAQQYPAPDIAAALHGNVRGTVIGIPSHYYVDHCTPDIAQAVLDAARRLEARGAVLRDVRVPLVEEAQAMATCIMCAEVSTLYQARLDTDPNSISADVRERLRAGLHYTGMDYARAIEFRRHWRLALHELYQHVDATLVPATATTAPPVSDNRSLLEATRHLARNTYPSALAGIPSLSVPCGRDTDGLPIGLLLESRWGNEGTLFAIATALTESDLPAT